MQDLNEHKFAFSKNKIEATSFSDDEDDVTKKVRVE